METNATTSFLWMSHSENLLQNHRNIFESSAMCDVIVAVAEGQSFRAHKLVLSSLSEYFYNILKEFPDSLIPTIIIPDVSYQLLEKLMLYMYIGEITIDCLQEFSNFLELCDLLKIKGISHKEFKNVPNNINDKKNYELIEYEEYLDNDDTENIDDQQRQQREQTEKGETLTNMDSYMKVFICDKIEDEYINTRTIKTEQNTSFSDSFREVNYGDAVKQECKELEQLTNGQIKKYKSKSVAETPKRIKKTYNRDTLALALQDIKAGKLLPEVAQEYKIPKSTLYMKTKSRHITNDRASKIPYSTVMEEAISTVVDGELSLKKASDKYNIPKTVLWRRVHKTAVYNPKRISSARFAARKALEKGESLNDVHKKFQIPKATLYRDKVKLIENEKLPETSRRRYNSKYDDAFKQALEACDKGMSKNAAAKIFKVPKSTLWRYTCKDKNKIGEVELDI